MKRLSVPDLAKISITAAIYVALTLSIAPFSYGPIQFRFAEVLNLLAFFNPIYIAAITLGCFISNLFSPMGVYDVVFGTLHTLISLTLVWKSRHILTASLWPALMSFIIALELTLAIGAPFAETWLFVAFSEVIICTLIGVPLIWFIFRTGFITRQIQDRSAAKWKNNPIWPGFLLKNLSGIR